MDKIFEQLQGVVDRYDELQELMSDPDVIADTKRYMELSKEEGSIREVVSQYKHYRDVVNNIKESEEVLHETKDPDLEELAKDDLSRLNKEKTALEESIKMLMLPKDPNDDEKYHYGNSWRCWWR